MPGAHWPPAGLAEQSVRLEEAEQGWRPDHARPRSRDAQDAPADLQEARLADLVSLG